MLQHAQLTLAFSLVLSTLQVLGATPAGSDGGSCPFKLLLREAILACHSSGCSNAQLRLLRMAEALTGVSQEEQLWLKVLSSKLKLPNMPTGVADCVSAHVNLLLEQGAPLRHDSSSSGARSGAGSAVPLAASYLLLGSLLAESGCDIGAAQQVPWQQLQQCSLAQLLAAAPTSTAAASEGSWGVAAAAAATEAGAVPEQHVPAAACCAAAAAAAPAAAEPWKAYGDLLFGLAGQLQQPQQEPDSAAGLAGQKQQQHLLLLAAASEAYCNHLAAAVNSKGLATPEQGLGVLLRLLEIILQHADDLQPQLQEAVGNCPVSAWQVVTPQLLGQLQHNSAAVRGLVQQLLQGLADVVPCAVLYPLIVEVRAAQEAGTEVRCGLHV